MDEQYIISRKDLDKLILIFDNLAEILAKGDEAIILVQSRFYLKEIIESAIEEYNQRQQKDKKE